MPDYPKIVAVWPLPGGGFHFQIHFGGYGDEKGFTGPPNTLPAPVRGVAEEVVKNHRPEHEFWTPARGWE